MTFGYAQPEHNIRIAVFSWPDCSCVVSIEWEKRANGELGRALWAIPYPGGPNDAVPSRRQTGGGFAAWDAVRRAEAMRGRRSNGPNEQGPETNGAVANEEGIQGYRRGRSMIRGSETSRSRNDSMPAARRRRERLFQRAESRATSTVRGEGETWASRTEEEGSLIIACSDQTVKFFEVWTGKSKGSAGGKGLGSRPGVLGGSRVLEGWCEGIGELSGSRVRLDRWSEEVETIR